MKLRDRTRQRPTVRSLGESVAWECLLSGSVLPFALLGGRRAQQRPCRITVTPAVLLKRLPPGPVVSLESP